MGSAGRDERARWVAWRRGTSIDKSPPLGTGPLPLSYTHTKKDRISYATGFAFKVPLQILEFIEQKHDTHALIRTIGTALNSCQNNKIS